MMGRRPRISAERRYSRFAPQCLLQRIQPRRGENEAASPTRRIPHTRTSHAPQQPVLRARPRRKKHGRTRAERMILCHRHPTGKFLQGKRLAVHDRRCSKRLFSCRRSASSCLKAGINVRWKSRRVLWHEGCRWGMVRTIDRTGPSETSAGIRMVAVR